VYWDFRRMNELAVSLGDAYQDQAVSTIYVGPGHGEYAAFQPGSAIAMGYDDLKVIEAYAFLRSIAEDVPYGASLQDAVRAATVLNAMAQSAETGGWITVAP
jgi:predicted dehydrogenase